MRQLITHDDIDEEQARPGRPVREMVDRLVAWATDDELFELAPDVSPCYLLAVAAEQLQMDGALALAERARAHPSADGLEAHPTLVSIHLERDDRDAAIALDTEFRRAVPASYLDAERMAETWEFSDDPVRAQRWFAIGMRLVDADGAAGPDTARLDLASGRFRVRRRAGLPWDALDTDVARWREESGLNPIV